MAEVRFMPYYEKSLEPARKWAAILDSDGKSYGAVAATKEEAQRIVTEWVDSIRSTNG